MGFALPNGSHVYLASGYDPTVPFTGAPNAEHTVVTVEARELCFWRRCLRQL